MELDLWDSQSGDSDFCVHDLKDEEEHCYSSELPYKLQFRKATSKARWVDDLGMAEVVEIKGQTWTTTGIIRGGKIYSSIEETLFLMEIGALHLLSEDDSSLSLSIMYEKLAQEKNGCSWELYEVYRHLKLLGYIVGRHGVPWSLKGVKTGGNSVSLEGTSKIEGIHSLCDEKLIIEKFSVMGLHEWGPGFAVYLPNSKFRKSSPGNPSFIVCLVSGDYPPLKAEIEALERQCEGIPLKLCHVEHGRVSFFSFCKVGLPLLP